MFEKVYRRVLLLRACIELYEAHMVKFELKPRISWFDKNFMIYVSKYIFKNVP